MLYIRNEIGEGATVVMVKHGYSFLDKNTCVVVQYHSRILELQDGIKEWLQELR
jgi:delta-aminolevulinic acid dehydratase/porphobilinogen synthase